MPLIKLIPTAAKAICMGKEVEVMKKEKLSFKDLVKIAKGEKSSCCGTEDNKGTTEEKKDASNCCGQK